MDKDINEIYEKNEFICVQANIILYKDIFTHSQYLLLLKLVKISCENSERFIYITRNDFFQYLGIKKPGGKEYQKYAVFFRKLADKKIIYYDESERGTVVTPYFDEIVIKEDAIGISINQKIINCFRFARNSTKLNINYISSFTEKYSHLLYEYLACKKWQNRVIELSLMELKRIYGNKKIPNARVICYTDKSIKEIEMICNWLIAREYVTNNRNHITAIKLCVQDNNQDIETFISDEIKLACNSISLKDKEVMFKYIVENNIQIDYAISQIGYTLRQSNIKSIPSYFKHACEKNYANYVNSAL